jgi:serine/alanine adding enzyme
MRVVQSLDEKKWRRFINEHQESNVFHTPEVFHVFARAKNHIPKLWAVLDDNGDVLALFLPVNVTLYRRLRVLTTRAIAYGSVLFPRGRKGFEALTLLLNTYRKNVGKSLLFTELRNLSDLTDAQPILHECGFEYTDELNYLFSLDRDVDSVLQRIGRATRKHIRRGLRRGLVEISEVKDYDELGEWYVLLEKTYNRARIPLGDRSLFDAVFDVMVTRRMAKFLVGRVNGKVVVCSLILLYKDRIFDWYGGVDRSYGKCSPSELMIWYELKWGSENGYRIFDFGLAGNPNVEYGVRNFKAKFRGKEVCYGRNTHIHLPGVFRLTRLGYEGYRAFLRFAK